MRVLFIDPVCQDQYRLTDLGRRPLGGTEATLLRVAAGLASRGHQITICQKSRRHSEREGAISFRAFEYRKPWTGPAPDAVVCLRSPKVMRWLRKEFPKQKLFLWLHCFPGTRRHNIGTLARRHQFTVLAVSHSHASFIQQRCGVGAKVIYNPLQPNLDLYRGEPKDLDSLIFYSSPHKGLAEVLDKFAALRDSHPYLKLKVANPGYLTGENIDLPGVVDLGPLPHAEVLKEVASSLCVFYPQTTFAETFGLIFAEANAVGTPVLAHDLGSAREILSSRDQIVDCTDPHSIADTISQWRSLPPSVGSPDPNFSLTRILDDWEALLMEASYSRRQELLAS